MGGYGSSIAKISWILASVFACFLHIWLLCLFFDEKVWTVPLGRLPPGLSGIYSWLLRLFEEGKEQVESWKRKSKRKRTEPVGACFLGGIPAEGA